MTDIVVAQRMWQRRDTAANWSSVNPILQSGEIGVETQAVGTAVKFKIGDGTTPWNSLPYQASALQPYTHNQSVAATSWTINHNLGYKPSVELLTAGGVEFDAEVVHTSNNQVVVNLVVAIAGSARLI